MKIFSFFALTKLIFFVTILNGQPVWPEEAVTTIGVEILKPNLRGQSSSFATAVFFISGRFPVSQTTTILGELPFAHYGVSGTSGVQDSESSTIMGNPYLGIEFLKPSFPVYAEIGFRLPLGTDRDEFYEQARATDLGMAASPERFEAFTLYDVAIKTRLHYRGTFGSNFLLHLQGGWSGGHVVEQDYGPSNFSTLDYTIQLAYQIQQVHILAGLHGRYLLDGRTFHMSRFASTGLDRKSHQLAVAASMKFANVRPGIYFNILLDDYLNDLSRPFVSTFLEDEIRFVLGLNVLIELN